jgi:membrane protease YdiL (CAAX protease family)
MSRRPLWPFAALLVIWGNAVPPLFGASAQLPGGSWSFVLAGIALMLVSLATARAYGLTSTDLGLDVRSAPRGAAIGALATIIALAGVGAIRLAPLVVGQTVAYEPLDGVSSDQLVRHLAFFLPFGAVLPEEVAFRGTLLGALAARYGARAAVVGSASMFAVWHGTVVSSTIGATTIAPPSPWALPATLGALVLVFGGGVLLAALRLRTGTIASTIVAHWGFNAVVLVGLRALAA